MISLTTLPCDWWWPTTAAWCCTPHHHQHTAPSRNVCCQQPHLCLEETVWHLRQFKRCSRTCSRWLLWLLQISARPQERGLTSSPLCRYAECIPLKISCCSTKSVLRACAPQLLRGNHVSLSSLFLSHQRLSGQAGMQAC